MNTPSFYLCVAGTLLALSAFPALAQTNGDHPHNASHQMDNSHHMGSSQHMMPTGRQPTLPGQDAFGAIQEIISILESDSSTDWSRVNISALREHLADMNRLIMDTTAVETRIEGGLSIKVTGQGKTVNTIHNMIPAHAPMINGINGWSTRAELTPNGAILTVTATTQKEIAHIQGLGFYGLMASGAHHQIHHLGLARGENVHGQ